MVVNEVYDDELPEFINVCKEIQTGSKQLNDFVGQLIQKFKCDKSLTLSGLSIFDVKNDTVLSYLINIVYLIFKKCSGKKLEYDKAIERIAETRIVLERIKPLQQKLKYQIEKLVKVSLTGDVNHSDKTDFKANPTDMTDDSESEQDSGSDSGGDRIEQSMNKKKKKKSGVYKPPKLAAVPYDDDNRVTKRQKLLERATRRALNSSVMQELKEEYLDTPLEISHTNTLRNVQMKHEKDRQDYEETYFTRLPITKEDHRKKKLTMNKLGSDITHFEDISALEGRLPAVFKKSKSVKRAKSSKSFSKSKRKRVT